VLVPFLATTELTATDYSILHPIFAVAVAAGAVFMAAMARVWEQQELPRFAYPIGIAGSGIVGIVLLAVVLPDAFDFFVSQFERVAGLGSTDTASTIGEAQAPSDPIGFFYQNYGLGFYTALAGFGLLLYRALARTRVRADHLLIAVFGAFMLLFTLTQIRFDYYLVTAIGAGTPTSSGGSTSSSTSITSARTSRTSNRINSSSSPPYSSLSRDRSS